MLPYYNSLQTPFTYLRPHILLTHSLNPFKPPTPRSQSGPPKKTPFVETQIMSGGAEAPNPPKTTKL